MKKIKVKPLEIVFLIVFVIVVSFGAITFKNILKEKELSESINIDYIVTDDSNKDNAELAKAEENGQNKSDTVISKIVVPGDAIAVVYVPSVGIKGKIANGTDENTLKNYVGKFEGSADPGAKGNFAIAAHNNIYTEIFRKLNKVKIGDEVKIFTKEKEYTYKVFSIQTVLPDNVDVLKTSDKSIITLITCNNTASKRIVVQGELVI